MISLLQLFTHPVKSMRGLQISHSHLSLSGLDWDRHFMVTETDGTFLTARTYPQLVHFTPSLTPDGLIITSPHGDYAHVRYDDFTNTPETTQVWDDQFPAWIAHHSINQWLSIHLKRDVQLRWIGIQPQRHLKRQAEIPLSFADGYPFLLISQASFQEVQRRCPAGIRIEQFRPNLVVCGTEAFAEDSWQTLRIGDVIFDVAKPCGRCTLTTVDIERAQPHPQQEPLATLEKFRQAENGDVDFGQNLIARNSGIIRVGDTVEILATKPSRCYIPQTPSSNPTTHVHSSSPKTSVTLTYGDISFVGNTQQILLEQLEQQGIRIPYSCRAGLCGCCRLQLKSGEVNILKANALTEGEMTTVLACSCIPKSDLVLNEHKSDTE